MIRVMTRGGGVSPAISLSVLLLLWLSGLAEAEHVCKTKLRNAITI